MKNNTKYLLALVSVLMWACTPDVPVGPEPDPDPDPKPEPEPEPTEYFTDAETIASLWHSRFADGGEFSSAENVQKARWIVDGKAVMDYRKSLRQSSADLRYEFYTEDNVRFISESDGYGVTLPLSLGLKPDFTLAKYAQKFESEDVTLRITMERVTPYPQTEQYYKIYTGEWLNRYISNSTYIAQNGMAYLESTVEGNESIIEGCSVDVYSINADGLDKSYYKIALVRPVGQWGKFGFLLYKCKDGSSYRDFNSILRSFRIFTNYGSSKNFIDSQEARFNPRWNAETKAYYQKLLDQKTFDFGVFSYSMPSDDNPDMESQGAKMGAEKERLEAVFGRPYDIMPTYTHIAWYSEYHYFPTVLANRYAGGNGFNNKPVLQFTYQFTTNNNNVNAGNTTVCYTPMFDILRGKLDDHFKTLARQIKEYAHPILFRLNNEMNSDWTSYCGMMTLCDPDLFVDTWRYLYDLFEAEGVDNCIWIFNPCAVSCPYSRWGEDLPYYPGNDYVQILGVTNYEMGNNLPLESFRSRYTLVYNNNKDIFGAMPWIISEFACGSGGATSGEEMRNGSAQADWVRAMFSDFIDYDANEYLHPLKGGVWFSCNDYSWDGQTTNYLYLDPALTETLDAFTWGFSEMYK